MRVDPTARPALATIKEFADQNERPRRSRSAIRYQIQDLVIER